MKSDKKAKELSAGRAKRSRKPKPRDGGRTSLDHGQSSGLRPEEAKLLPMLEALKPHDHLCLIYESKAEWRAAAVPFISVGLKRGEKCLYIVDTSTADEIRTYLGEEGIDVASAEKSGQLAILNETDAYTREGFFDPDRMIALLIAETEKAEAEGFPALRVTGEMTCVLRGYPGSERLLEYEAKLNRDFFPNHPCLAICQYDRWKFDPEIIKGVVMTHPLLINQNKVYRNFYYIPPVEFLNAERAKLEVQHWLNNLEREKLTWEALQESEEKYRALVERANDGIITIQDGIVKYVNPRAAEIWGGTTEEIIGTSFAEYVHPDELSKVAAYYQRRMAGGDVSPTYETVLKRKDGGKVYAELNAGLITYQGRPADLVIVRDISERKQAEEALKAERHLFRTLMDNIPDAIYFKDAESRFVRINQAQAARFGLGDPFQAVGKTDFDFFTEEHARPAYEDEQSIIRSGEPIVDKEEKETWPDGHEGWVSTTKMPLRDREGRIVGTFGISHEITERKRADEMLHLKMEQLTSVSQATQAVTASLDLDHVLAEIVSLAGKVAPSNYASVVRVDEEGQIKGRSAETLPGAPALEYRARGEGFTHWIIRTLRPVVVDDIGEDGGIRSDLEDGAPTTVNPVLLAYGIKSFVGLPLIFKGRLLGVLYLHSLRPHTFRDQLPILTAFANQAAVAVENADLYDAVRKELTERKAAEEKLQSTVSLLQATLDSTADGILVVDLEGKIQRFNENFKKMWRIPPAILETGEDDRALGFVLDQLKDPEKFLSKVRQLYGEVLAESYDVLDFKDGRVFERFSRPQLLGDIPVGRVWSFRDVTERVKDEEKLRAALGEREVMLREIHHRVKNNIQIISSLLRLQSRYIKDEKALELLDESQNRIRSMALIHEKLYQSQDFSRIDFSDYIAKMITHLFAIYKVESSRIRHRVDAQKVQLDINRAIPCGLIINELITNALKHAFPEDREGEIFVRMRLLAGDQYELTVKDNGVGMPAGLDPARKGTLGFQIVSDLVKQLDGSIEVRRDAGTEIIIRF